MLSYAFLQQRNVEQIVDTPVPLGRGRRRLQDSLPRQGSTASGAVQIADSPFGGGLHGFSQGWFLQRPASRSLLTALLEVFKVFLLDMSPDSDLGSRTSTSQLPGFRSRRARCTGEQNVDILVPRSHVHGGL